MVVRAVGDQDLLDASLTIDAPLEREVVASYRLFSGHCREGFAVTVLAGVDVVAPAEVECVAGTYQAPVSFSGVAGDRAVTVQQTDALGTTARAARTVVLSLAGMNRPVGFDRPPTLLLADPLASGRIYAIGARLYGNTELYGVVRLLANGTPDPTFAVSKPIVAGGYTAWGLAVSDPPIVAGAIDPVTGKLYVAGNLSSMGDVPVTDLVRLNPDGSIDAGFSVGSGFVHSSGNAFVGYVTYDAARSLLYVAGQFDTVNGVASPTLVRLTAEGAVDSTFSVSSGFGGVSNISSMLVDADQRLTVSGCFSSYNGVARPSVLRLNADGSLDTSFDPGAGPSCCCPYTSALDTVSDALYVGGSFGTFAGLSRRSLVRLQHNGSVDMSFDTGTQTSFIGPLWVRSDGNVVACSTTAGATNPVMRFYSTGQADPSFQLADSHGRACQSLLPLPGLSRMFIGLDSWAYGNAVVDELIATDLDGVLDATYNSASVGFNDIASALLWDAQTQRLVAIGDFTRHTDAGGTAVGHIARITPDGALDLSFNPSGSGFNQAPWMLAAAPEGKLLVGGPIGSFNEVGARSLVRLNADGTRDPSFSMPEGIVTFGARGALVDSDQRILVGGSHTPLGELGLARLHTDGTVDPTFQIGTGLGDTFTNVYAFAWDAVRRELYVGGDFREFQGVACEGLVRLDDEGTIDPSFIPTGLGIFGIGALHWDSELDRLLAATNFSGVVILFNRAGEREAYLNAVIGHGLCYDAVLKRLYVLANGGATGMLAYDLSAFTTDPAFVSGKGPGQPITACAVDPTTHEVFLSSSYRLTAYDRTAVQGLVHLSADGSLVP